MAIYMLLEDTVAKGPRIRVGSRARISIQPVPTPSYRFELAESSTREFPLEDGIRFIRDHDHTESRAHSSREGAGTRSLL